MADGGGVMVVVVSVVKSDDFPLVKPLLSFGSAAVVLVSDSSPDDDKDCGCSLGDDGVLDDVVAGVFGFFCFVFIYTLFCCCVDHMQLFVFDNVYLCKLWGDGVSEDWYVLSCIRI